MDDESVTHFKDFEMKALEAIAFSQLSDDAISALVRPASPLSYEYTGAGYFITVRDARLPSERRTLSVPPLVGVCGDIVCGFVVFLDNHELTLEVHEWGQAGVSYDFRNMQVVVRDSQPDDLERFHRARSDVPARNDPPDRDVIGTTTIAAPRTFLRTFEALLRLNFSSPSGYVSVVLATGIMAVVFNNPAPWWIAGLGGLFWVAAFFPCMAAFKAWILVRTDRRLGPLVFSFDDEGMSCGQGSLTTRIPWSSIPRITKTRMTLFVFVNARVAWFIDRRVLGDDREEAIVRRWQQAR